MFVPSRLAGRDFDRHRDIGRVLATGLKANVMSLSFLGKRMIATLQVKIDTDITSSVTARRRPTDSSAKRVRQPLSAM